MAKRFEWDNAKATANLHKHGVSFQTATLAFEDPHLIQVLDDRQDYGEERIVLFGMARGQLLAVTYTERRAAIRIISAWKATRNEQNRYFRRVWT